METKKREFIEILKSFRDYYGTYHHHKEVMAWVATALYLSGCFIILLRTGIFRDFNNDLWTFIIVTIFFTGIFSIFFTFIFLQLRQRFHANIVVKACINLIFIITEKEGIKINYSKKEFKGVFWPRSLIDEYDRVEKMQPMIKLEGITYAILILFYLAMLVKLMWLFFG